MRIVCISDTHLVHRDGDFPIPDGDLLIHAGDATYHGTQEEIREFNAWFAALPHANKIFVAGNHDWAAANRLSLDYFNPYAREAISDVVTKGGFPQLLLSPVNFDMLYAQELQRRQQQGESQAH